MGNGIIQNEEAMKRIKELVVSDRPSTILVCIQGIEEGEVCGEIYSCYLRELIWFNGMGDMVLEPGEMCSWVGVPCVATDSRFLNMETKKRYREAGPYRPQADRNSLTYTMDQTPFRQALKAREMLIIYVRYRQFSSLQGSTRGKTTEGKVANFRSALELMCMISMIQL